ncbi:MAG TPA: hypothetical protein VLG09_02460 [Candidatus Saccharimonadales bacterium]|nr:hypothetical protein [Candidatus Saccharimonadales bacterium]
MKDLDFDELDRAVNSLMTNVPKAPEPKKTDENEQTLTITPTLKDDAAPSFKTLDKTVAQINNTPINTSDAPKAPSEEPSSPTTDNKPVSAAQPLASRRGRFMDMVRPNASPRVSETTRPASRQGATIEPSGPLLSDVVAPSNPAGLPATKTPVPSPKKDEDSVGEWPDPIEMTSTTEPVNKTEDDESLSKTLEPTSDELAKPAVTDSYTPLTTPFLADTKVEKRPLGGAAIEADALEPAEPQNVVEEQKITSQPDEAAQLPADPTEIAPLQLPEELSGDLVALEAGANTTAMNPDAVMTPEAEVAQPSQKPVEPKMDATDNSSQPPVADAVPNPDEKLLPAGPISIPQQYREEPSTGDKQSGSIYDTDTYHQPLSHPAKKKSGWMWVIWTIAILLVGAGCGAALYFMNIL